MGEKVSSGIWETCPKITGGYEYQKYHTRAYCPLIRCIYGVKTP